ncbi:MAG: nickel pincer cofactor biosynthesis protein LarB [Candidatus Omnitrophica bacterium]|nr:nickel pincer cofactor biosynthesis protein LarB [Candidatus Omnitrophota bacterium]
MSNAARLKRLISGLQEGKVSQAQAFRFLKDLPYSDLKFARVDHHRSLRKGCPEVIFAQGKTPGQVLKIARRIARRGDPVLVTRADQACWKEFSRAFRGARYDRLGRVITAANGRARTVGRGLVLVVTAGTADIPVAQEAVVTARLFGSRVETLYDVGVAGIHRLLEHREVLARAKVIIVVCGMEGALPSVIGGLVSAPVVAVPTSVGYGSHLGGFVPLLSILNTCAPGVVAVNIDNGFGAGYFANLVNRIGEK